MQETKRKNIKWVAADNIYKRGDEEYDVPLIKNNLRAELLTPQQREILLSLNDQLMLIEKKAYKDIEWLVKRYQKKIGDKTHWLTDLTISISIIGQVKTTDPFYDDENDNTIIKMTGDYHLPDENDKQSRQENRLIFGVAKDYDECNYSDQFGLYDGINHNTLVSLGFDEEEFHCYAYHSLYNHTHLDWHNMLRIDKFDFEIDIQLRHDCDEVYDES